MSITVRRFIPEDTAVVHALFQAGMRYHAQRHPDQAAGFESYIRHSMKTDLADIATSYSDDKRSCFFVACSAEHDNAVKGIVGVQPVTLGAEESYWISLSEEATATQPYRRDEVAELRRMSVDADMRGKGVAEKLLHALEEFCRSKGFLAMHLTTGAIMDVANRLYTKHGFTLTHREVVAAEDMKERFVAHHFFKML
eukprot:TRINITY_DN12831_c0_g1_i1.p1 TRINITY_DN12831_c0_g1~~TRINITY_DN12831_c0_g1_i1.p1  ORF type:complete len:197 (-),score=26.13 TRINITY_DN12831_c0_g1_i1:81-671(-)